MRTATYTMTAPEIALANLEVAAEKFNAVTEHMTAATRFVVMLAAAPFIGLLFVLTLPVVCAALTVYYSVKLAAARWTTVARHVKNVALFFAAPFIGLAYLLALPVVGLVTIAYLGVKATRR